MGMPEARIPAKEILVVHLSAWKMVTQSSLVWSASVLDVLWLITLESTLESPSIFPGSKLIWKVAVEAHLLHLDHHQQPLLLLQALDVEAHNGKVIISAMMKTTMLNAHLMVVTVVEMMSTHNIALLVNVLKVPPLPLPQALRVQEVVSLLNGLETTSATMETTMLNVASMAAIAAETMSIPNIVKNVNVLKHHQAPLLQPPQRNPLPVNSLIG